VQLAVKVNWGWEKCTKRKVRELQEQLQEALRRVDDLKVKNRELEAKLKMTKAEEKGSIPAENKEFSAWW
jgi:hypothetical protein